MTEEKEEKLVYVVIESCYEIMGVAAVFEKEEDANIFLEQELTEGFVEAMILQ